MKNVGKIIGFPAKLFKNNHIYIPKEYLRFYGISERKDKLLLSKSDRQLFYQPILDDGIEHRKDTTPSIIGGLTILPVDWVRRNQLKTGDTLFLLGTTEGLLVYISR